VDYVPHFGANVAFRIFTGCMMNGKKGEEKASLVFILVDISQATFVV